MEPGIIRSLKAGFQAANRSWPGIGLFAAAGLLIAVLSMVGLVVTNPPPELFQGIEGAPPQPPEAPLVAPASSASSPAAKKDETLFKQLEGTEGTTVPAPAAQTSPDQLGAPTAPPAELAPAAAPAAPSADDRRAAQERAVRAWLGRSWPILVLLVLGMAAASVWLSGGQIGYLVRQLTAAPASIAEFWRAANHAFVRLLGGSAIAMAVLLGLMLALALLQFLPPIVSLLLVLVLAAAAGWVAVRVSFWFLIIVAERQGPIAALAASFRATRGRWWKIFAIGLLSGLISYAVVLAERLLGWIASRAGGPFGMTLFLTGNLAGLVASLYVTFAALGALIRFYEDVKRAGASSPA